MSKKLVSLLLLLIVGSTLLSPAYSFAAIPQWTGDCVADTDVATIRGIVCLLMNLIKPFPAIIAIAALFMLIKAGADIIRAGDDPKAVASGMQTLTYAIIGIILLPVAYLILLTIEKFTGAKVTNFGIN